MDTITIPESTSILQVNLLEYVKDMDAVRVHIPSADVWTYANVESDIQTPLGKGAAVRIYSDMFGTGMTVRTNLGLFATDIAELHNRGYLLVRVEDVDGNSLHMKDVK